MPVVRDTRRFYRRGMGAVQAVWRPGNGEAMQEAMVYLDSADTAISLGIEVTARQHVMRYSAMALVGLANGETITVDGTDYRVRGSPVAVEDGSDQVAVLGRFDDL